MPPLWTIDSCVLVAAHRPQESDHLAARAVIQRVVRGEAQVVLPGTVLVEFACAIVRRTQGSSAASSAARAAVQFYTGLPNVTMRPRTITAPSVR